MRSVDSVATLDERSGHEGTHVGEQDPGATPQALVHAVTHRPLKVLFVTNMYPNGENPGAGAFVHQQAEHLRRWGHQVDVLHIESKRSRLKYFTSMAEVYARTRANSYDIVHAHYGLSGFPALFRHDTPLVVTLHGSDALVGHIQPFISKAVCSLSDAVIVVSKGICARIAGEIVPCGIDMGVFKPHDRRTARARLGLPAEGKLVLFPFDPARKIKRHELAQAAVDWLRDPNVRILTVGGMANEEMPWYYSAADVMILSSASEGSPTSVKEALACNIPVVSTDVGDVREIMEGIDGCEICPDNAESLGKGLKRVLDRQSERPFAARSSMLRYDQGRIVASIVKIYERTIDDRLAGRRRPVGHLNEGSQSS